MMKKKELKKFAVLFPIVLLAGCISLGGSSTGNGPGLRVASFATSDNNVEPNSPVDLTLVVSNDGGDIARNIHVTLGGLTDDWAIAEGIYRTIPDMDHVDSSRGITTPIEEQLDWTITPPGLSSSLSYQPNVQITYDYSTTLNTLINVASFNYYRLYKPTLGVVQGSSISNGPVSIDVTASKSAFSGSTTPVYFQFHNIGSGRVVGPSIDTVGVQVSGEGISCPSSQVKLISPGSGQPGKDGILTCRLTNPTVDTLKPFRITVSAYYTYSLTATTSITVLPTVS